MTRIVMLMVLAVHAAAQSSSPVELKPKQSPAFREIGAFYFDSNNESQVWINLEPAHADGPPDPIIVNATIKFPGTRLERAPATVELRPQVRCIPQVYMARPRLPIFKLTIGTEPQMDLSPDGKTSFFLPSCGSGPREGTLTYDTVSTQVPFALMQKIAAASSVTIDAIGFKVRMTPEDFAALKAFVQAVEHGVVVRRQ